MNKKEFHQLAMIINAASLAQTVEDNDTLVGYAIDIASKLTEAAFKNDEEYAFDTKDDENFIAKYALTPEAYREKVFKMRLSDIGISNRTVNCLSKLGVSTVADIMQYHPAYLHRKHCGLGKASIDEIKDSLRCRGIDWPVSKPLYR